MASAPSVTSLADEVNCPICQGTLREPVTIDCGHNFCRGCLTRYCEIPGPESEESLSCPLCKEPFRPGSFRPNWQLANVVENIERLQLASTQGLEVEDACPEHGEKVYFFCEEDEAQLCVVCREAGQHGAHTVRFLEDAAGPYRVGEHPCRVGKGSGGPLWELDWTKGSRKVLWILGWKRCPNSKFFLRTYLIFQATDSSIEKHRFMIKSKFYVVSLWTIYSRSSLKSFLSECTIKMCVLYQLSVLEVCAFREWRCLCISKSEHLVCGGGLSVEYLKHQDCCVVNSCCE